MDIRTVGIDEITPYDNNPRKNQAAIDKVAESIKEFGFQQPIVVDGDGVIIVGHTRHKAAQKLGLTHVPVIYARDLSEEQVKAYRLADNKTAEFSTWDSELLAAELSDLKAFDFDMTLFGFEDVVEPENVVEDEFKLEKELEEMEGKPTRTKLGDIWKLGRHRLLCGDSTDRETVGKLLDGQKADLYVTDPPYNVAYEGGTKDKLTILNDKMDNDNFRQFLIDAFEAANNVMKPGAAFYIWHADSEGYNFRGACLNTGWQVRQCLIWNKSSLVLGRQDYHWKHEPCLYGWKDGAAHYFVDDRTQSTVIEDNLNINKMKTNEMRQLLKQLLADKVSTTVINEDKPSRNGEHPTMKPVKLLARLINNSSKAGQKVMDTFGGSGSTLMACEQLNRDCYTMELDPKYCDVILKRWEEFTGQKAELFHQGVE